MIDIIKKRPKIVTYFYDKKKNDHIIALLNKFNVILELELK